MITWLVMFRWVGGYLMMTGMIAVISLCSLCSLFNNAPPLPHLSDKAEKFNLRFRSKWKSLNWNMPLAFLSLAWRNVIAPAFKLYLPTFSRNIQWQEIVDTHILPFKDHFPLAPGNLDQCHLIFGKNSFWHSFGIIWVGELSCLKPFESRDCSHEQLCPAHLFTVSWDEQAGWPDQLVLLRPLPGNQDWAGPLYNYMLEWAPVLALPPMPIVMGCLRRCSRDILVPPCIGWPPQSPLTSLLSSFPNKLIS